VQPVGENRGGSGKNLTGSNNTKTGDLAVFDTDNRKGPLCSYWVFAETWQAQRLNGMRAARRCCCLTVETFMFSPISLPAMRLPR